MRKLFGVWRLPHLRMETCGVLVRESKHASAQQILVSGTIGAFWLCSDKRLEQFRTYRKHSVKLTPCLFPQAIARALQVLHLRFLNPARPVNNAC